MNAARPLVLETFAHNGFLQNMERRERRRRRPRFNHESMFGFGEKAQHNLRLVRLWYFRAISPDPSDLLVKKRREKKEFAMAKGETIFAFSDAALA